MSADGLWQAWSQRVVAAAGDSTALRRAALSVARSMRDHLRPAGGLATQFAQLGVDVVEVSLAASGGCAAYDGRRVVFVAAGEPPARQRFTAAHEVAHLLLDSASSRARTSFQRADLERLCDDFASELLIGRDRLSRSLSVSGVPRDPEALLRLCGTYGVGLHAMMLALRPFLAGVPVVLMTSSRRGHPERPDVVDFRIDAAVGHRRLFIPSHQRLRSVGLHDLADWADTARHSHVRDGEEIVAFTPRRVAEPVWPGRAGWMARAHGRDAPSIVAALDVATLVRRPTAPLAFAA
jgi:uncharacterized protein DUF955